MAMKIVANSVYGFAGAHVGQLPCIPVSSSVTAYGRDMILECQKIVQRKYCRKQGFIHDAQILYGDTDSMMIKFGVKSKEEALLLAKECAQYVTSHFKKPIRLVFEKIYHPYLLMAKKKYAGKQWIKKDKVDEIIDAAGLETRRRDYCSLVGVIV